MIATCKNTCISLFAKILKSVYIAFQMFVKSMYNESKMNKIKYIFMCENIYSFTVNIYN